MANSKSCKHDIYCRDPRTDGSADLVILDWSPRTQFYDNGVTDVESNNSFMLDYVKLVGQLKVDRQLASAINLNEDVILFCHPGLKQLS